MSEYLVDVIFDVHRRSPRFPAVARAHDTADVDVDVKRAVGGYRDRSHVGGITPRRVPRVAPLCGLERVDALEPGVGESPEVSLLRADEQTGRRRRDAGRRRSIDRGDWLPRLVAARAQLRAIDDRPDRGAVDRKRGHSPAGERLNGS